MTVPIVSSNVCAEKTLTAGDSADYVLSGALRDSATVADFYDDGDPLFYVVSDGGAGKEIGSGVYHATPNTISVTAVLYSSNGGARVDWPPTGQRYISVAVASPEAAGTVSVGTANQLAYYAAGGNTVSGVTLSGDATFIAGALTLATVNSNVGSFGAANITVNAKGLITAASNGTVGNVTAAGTLGSGQIVLGAGTTAVSASAALLWGATTGIRSNLNVTAAMPAAVANGSQIVGTDGAQTGVSIHTFAANAGLFGRRAGGTLATPAATENGAVVVGMFASGFDTTYTGQRAQIIAQTSQLWAAGANGIGWQVWTTPNGSTTSIQAGTIANDGGIIWPATVTGGTKGAGSINATTIYQNNVPIVSAAGTLGSGEIVLGAGTTAVASSGVFIWNATNGIRANINGGTAPTAMLNGVQVIGADSGAVGLSVHSYANYAGFQGRRFGGTLAAPAATENGVAMTALTAAGYDTTATGIRGQVSIHSSQLWASGKDGTTIKFFTTPNDSTTLTEAGSIASDGGLIWSTAVTGGSKGAGTINAAALYVNGVAVSTGGGLSSTLASAHLFVGNASNVATDVVITGDVTISNAGVTAIGSAAATVAKGGLGTSAAVSGAIPYGTSTSAAAWSGLLAANAVVLGGGVGVAPATTANFVWSASAGVQANVNGGTAPATMINGAQIVGADAAAAGVSIHTYANYAGLQGRRFGGSLATPAATENGVAITALTAAGFDTTATGIRGQISIHSSQLWAAGADGTTIKFYTTPNSSTTLTEAGSIANDGGLIWPTSVTGGTKGAGTINAAGLYVNGVAVSAGGGLSSTLSSAHLFVGNVSNVATDVAVTGDVTISNAGVTAIGTNKVSNAMAAQMAQHTFKGNNTAGTANAADLSISQMNAELLGNSFFAVAGPATSVRTFTFPNASATVLTDNAAVTVGQGGLGTTAAVSGAIPYGSSTSAAAWSGLLAANGIMLGGGAAAAPATSAALVWSSTIGVRTNLNSAAMPSQIVAGTQIVGADTTQTGVSVHSFASNTGFFGRRYGGSLTTPAATENGSVITGLFASGYDTAATGQRAEFLATASQLWAAGKNGVQWDFFVTPNDSVTLTQAGRIANDGGIVWPTTVTGGSQGAGTINAAGLYVNGVAVSSGSGLSSTLASAHLFVGNVSNVATDVAITGDVTISNAGVTAIGAHKVTSAMSAQMAQHTFKGNNTAGTADALDLTIAQMNAELLGNSFFAVTGPTTSVKTFTFPNASATVLTDNADVTVTQGGTGLSVGVSGGVPYFDSTTSMASSALLAANGIVVGGGAAAAPTTNTVLIYSSTVGLRTNLNGGTLPSAVANGHQIVGVDSAQTGISIHTYASNAGIFGRRFGGSLASPSATVSGATIIGLFGSGFDTAATSQRAQFSADTAQLWAAGKNGTSWGVYTTPIDSVTLTHVGRWYHDGTLYVGATTSQTTKATGAGTVNADTGYFVGNVNVTPGHLASTNTNPSNPTGSASTTGLMMGLAGSITPVFSGRVLIIVTGSIANNTTTDGAKAQIYHGTGSAPANGDALTGTAVGGLIQCSGLVTAGSRRPFCLTAVVTGLTLAAHWIDVGLAASGGGTATIADLTISTVEL